MRACKTRRPHAAPRVSFELGGLSLPDWKKTTMHRRSDCTLFARRTHTRDLSRGLFVTQRSVANVRVDAIYS